MKFLRAYKGSSGQLIKVAKSSFIVSDKAPGSLSRSIADITGFVQAKLPIKYLGVSLFAGRRRPSYFSHILAKTAAKLQTWKSGFLSSGGHLVLIRHVLSALPIYTMSSQAIPTTVINTFHRLLANFFWGSYDGSPKKHWVSWDIISQPKDSGGLGVLNLSQMQLALKTKMLWRAISGTSFWGNFFQAKHLYHSHHSTASFHLLSAADRKLWQHASRLVAPNHRVVVKGLDSQATFWLDVWAGAVPLRRFLSDHVWSDLADKCWSINQVLADPTHHHIHIAHQFCPPSLLGHIFACNDGLDRWIWCPTTNGQFSTNSVRKLLQGALRFGAAVTKPDLMLSLWWPVRFYTESWCVHVSDSQKTSQLHIFDLSAPHRSFLQQWGITLQVSAPLAPKIVRWYLPPPGRLKLNVDGAYKSTSSTAAGGGILRNEMGDMIFAFAARYHGVHSSLEAEALALRNGIILCYEKGFSEFLIKSDSLVLVQIMKGQYSIPWRLSIATQDIFHRCQNLHVSFRHIYHEANQVADSLVGHGCTIACSCCVWSFWADLPPTVKGPYQGWEFRFRFRDRPGPKPKPFRFRFGRFRPVSGGLKRRVSVGFGQFRLVSDGFGWFRFGNATVVSAGFVSAETNNQGPYRLDKMGFPSIRP
ncbi:hypothetical protein Taro_019165 [Colocasia esculenta]|uniref:RNase H type-1 domain-containing protein n=1 Tax=Colocasia esculenta TaxID=4460 RepID=A0A843UT12_COLES|nr:hypothetical protein [Colocasia esculenta]